MFTEMKKILILTTIIINFNGIAHAGIPGITEPFDPPNYYSPENVSIPDSAPSPFTLTDLANNGYLVHDVKSTKKDIISSIKTYTEYLNVAKNYLLDLTDLIHAEDNNFSNILKQEKDSIIHSSTFNDDANIDKIDDYLYNLTTSNYKDNYINLNDKYIYLDNIYKTAYSLSRNELSSLEERQKNLDYTINKLTTISSTMQGQEALSLLDTLKQLELLKQQQLINNLTTINVAKIRDNKDDNFRLKRENLRFFNLNFEDPYNPSDYYKKHYTKTPGKGFADFE
ncbi:hypothetical protein [Megamonas rupellensis]|uniref:hypothetical protein n=1 Tax=Megamonas rupellensis TaxID=491921 RepID=UPI00241D0959|nr:hypothetical protein [Megamonas rupellensis]